MSEYQYYEFQAVDRPLTEQEQAYVRSLSSRVNPTPTQAVFTYSYGDFRGEPLDLLARCFDALLYLANWGSKQLAFRFPRELLDLERLTPYYYGVDEIELVTSERHVLLDISFHEEGGWGGWIEGEGVLSTLLPLRGDILRGDLRVLYLAWLGSAQGAAPREAEPDGAFDGGWGEPSDEDADEWADATGGGEPDELDPAALLEPPVPPGLGQLSAPLRAFAEVFAIDQDLIAAAAEASPPLDDAADQIERWVALLPATERDAFLVRVARGEPHVGAHLLRRLREAGGASSASPPADAPRRTFADLLAAAERQRRRREARERQEAEAARLRRLEALARREPEMWALLPELVARRTASAYDEATALLVELRELADHRGNRAQFTARLDALARDIPLTSALFKRLQKARLR